MGVKDQEEAKKIVLAGMSVGASVGVLVSLYYALSFIRYWPQLWLFFLGVAALIMITFSIGGLFLGLLITSFLQD